jgi:hypothetical protein
MVAGNKKSLSLQEIKEQLKYILSGVDVNNDLESETAIKIFSELDDDNSFNQEIEALLACLNEQTLDLTKLQTQIIVIIKKYLGKFQNRKLSVNIDERLISKDIREISDHLMHYRSKLIQESMQSLIKSKDNLYNVDNKIIKDVKRIIKNFAIYQAYKFMNPRKIAGETKKDNFANNYIKGGMNLAKQYEGGSKSDLKKYSPEFLQKLEKAHKSFKSGRSI